jgi:hypothetical protein
MIELFATVCMFYCAYRALKQDIVFHNSDKEDE